MPRNVAPIGTHANAWSNVATGAGGFSAVVDTYNAPYVSAFGVSDGAAVFTLQYSANGTTFYDSQVKQTLSGAGDFALDVETAARYVRLKSSANVTATATIMAKDN